MNDNLHKAKAAKNDEFYTQLSDIEKELSNYPADTFKNKIIYCPCDVGVDGLDIPKSNFVKYFEMNKERLGYKQLLHTSLQEGYDFHSDYCTRLLTEADIVVTNPPFSLFRDFFKWLMQYPDKKFIIVGNQNAITYKDFFPYLQEDRVRIGSQTGIQAMFFEVTDDMEIPDDAKRYVERNYKEKAGNRRITYLRTTCWFTNCDLSKHHNMSLYTAKYSEEKYPKYDNYDAIDVNKVSDIPYDYYGEMGVPITYMYQHNAEQFEIVGISGTLAKSFRDEDGKLCSGRFYVNGKRMYDRIVIKRRGN